MLAFVLLIIFVLYLTFYRTIKLHYLSDSD